MGVRILNDGKRAVIYDSVSDIAFGPVFYDLDPSETGLEYGVDAEEVADAFLNYLRHDARKYDSEALMEEYWSFRKLIEDAGWKAVLPEEAEV